MNSKRKWSFLATNIHRANISPYQPRITCESPTKTRGITKKATTKTNGNRPDRGLNSSQNTNTALAAIFSQRYTCFLARSATANFSFRVNCVATMALHSPLDRLALTRITTTRTTEYITNVQRTNGLFFPDRSNAIWDDTTRPNFSRQKSSFP